MKHLYRIFITVLLIVFLTACTVTNIPASSPNPATASANLTIDSTPGLPPLTEMTQTGPQPAITEAGFTPGQETGELYFFTLPHQAGQSIQLVRVSASCVTRVGECPPVQAVSVPFPFNFTLTELSWSPDGSKAAFAYPDNPNGSPTKLFVFDPAASTWTALAQFPYIDPPFWSPDGTWIAFREQDGQGGEDVYVVHRDGTELKSISANLPAEKRPYIMDGWYTENIIMRPALPGNEGIIYLVRASDGFVRPMIETLLTKSIFVTAPDSSMLAYDDYDYQSQNHILRLVEPDGANPIDIANFTGGNLYPIVWSPDSSKLAFVYQSFAAGQPSADVLVVNRDGKGISQVYKGVTVGRVLFSPRGRYLIVEETTSPTGGHLFVVDLATLEVRILEAPGLSLDTDWYAPSWRP
jgi:Tol biopolymer transport system component